MKKTLFLILLSSLISCGESVVKPAGFDQNLNQSWAIKDDDFFSADEKLLAQDLCDSFAAKFILFTAEYTNNKKMTFELSQKTCDDNEYRAPTNVQVGVRSLNSGLYFETGTYFPDIIGKGHPELSSFCSRVKDSGDVSRVIESGSKARWYMLSDEEDDDCDKLDDDKAICLKIYTGLEEEDSDSYKISKLEFLKTTNKNGSKEGVIVKRELQTALTCEGSQFESQLQVLKSL